MNTSQNSANHPEPTCPCGGPLDRLGYCVRSLEATARLTDRRRSDPWARGALEGASVEREVAFTITTAEGTSSYSIFGNDAVEWRAELAQITADNDVLCISIDHKGETE
jgi:hypothetical protein